MLVGQQGYVPEPHFFTETLRSQNRFHDPHQDSLFSNAWTVQGFRDWTNSGRSSPLNSDVSLMAHRTLPVRSTRPICHPETLGVMQKTHAKLPVWDKISDNIYEAQVPSLITPRSAVPGGTRSKSIRYAILEVRIAMIIAGMYLTEVDSSGTHCWIAVTLASMVLLCVIDSLSFTYR
jgi:60kDa lysophospholipase